MLIRFLSCSVILCFSSFMEGSSIIRFKILDKTSLTILGQGQEEIDTDGEWIVKHTRYVNDAQRLEQQEDARFHQNTFASAEYSFVDHKTGEEAHLKVPSGDKKAEVSYRKSQHLSFETKNIDWNIKSRLGKAIPEMILREWDWLRYGRTIEFELYVPFLLRTLQFNIYLKAQNDERAVFHMEASQFFVRLLAPQMDFEFTVSHPRRILRYIGPSMIDIHGEKNLDVIMTFDPPEEKTHAFP